MAGGLNDLELETLEEVNLSPQQAARPPPAVPARRARRIVSTRRRVLSAAAAATHDLPTPREEQKDLVAVDKGTGAVEAAALQDNTVNECPPSENPAAMECSVQCESLCTDFLRAECCYEQGGVCFCDT